MRSRVELKKVSVIVPVYNVEKYLAECLESILSQDLKGIEVICVNDGSTDNSINILNDYARKDNRMVIVSQKNSGLAEARNQGLKVANGEYVCFVDSDDKLAENALTTLYNTAIEKAAQMVTFEVSLQYDFDVKDSKKGIDRYYTKSKDYTGNYTGKELFVQMMRNADYCDSAWLIFAKRNWLIDNEIDFYPHIYFEDVLFSLKCYMKADFCYHLSENLYIYRIRENSIMQSKASIDKVYSCIVNLEKLFEVLITEQNVEEEFKEMLVKYMRLVVMNLHIIEAKRQEKDNFERFNYIDKFIYDSLFIGGILHPDERIILHGIIKNVEDSSGVYLYGAGKIGKLLGEFLLKKNLINKVKGYIVTSKEGQEDYCLNMPVYTFSEVDIGDELVILSVGREIQQQVLPKLKLSGISNIICIDRNVEMVLEREHERTV